MRRRRRVAHQHDVLVVPPLAEHAREVEPRRAAQVLGVRHQGMAAEMVARRSRSQVAMLSSWLISPKPKASNVFWSHLDDERRGVGVELVGVRPDPAVFGLLEDEGEGVVELLVRAEPDELAAAACRSRAGRRPRTPCGSGSSGRPPPRRRRIRPCSRRAPWTSVSKRSSTPSSRARSCSRSSSRLRPIPQKPWPVDTVRTPSLITAMSSQ